MSRAVMQQALEALERYQVKRQDFDRFADEITALRAALLIDVTHAQMAHADSLAEPEQEPVAWMWRCKPFCNWPEWNVSLKRPADSGRDGNTRTEGYEDVPLYTAPTPRRPLTDKEIEFIYADTGYNDIQMFARAIEAAHGIGEQHE